MGHAKVAIPEDDLARLCRRWGIRELRLFGSALREDFGPESDIDLLVEFGPDPPISLLDHIQVQEELASLLGRKVDLVTRQAVEGSRNPIRRQEILSTAEVLYASG
ncbi:MAG TPA: nucleotidyltransferase family protein [Armatimonadota bacterium]